jgi:hypothetical protein
VVRILVSKSVANLRRHCFDGFQVQAAIAIAWRSDTYKRYIGIEQRFIHIRGRPKSAVPVAFKNQFFQTVLDDWTLAGIYHADFVGIDIYSPNLMATLREACGRHAAYVS